MPRGDCSAFHGVNSNISIYQYINIYIYIFVKDLLVSERFQLFTTNDLVNLGPGEASMRNQAGDGSIQITS